MVAEVAAEIAAIRLNAASLWEQGWLSGRRPGETIDFSDLLNFADGD